MDEVITTELLVKKHGYQERTAQRRIKDAKEKLGKTKDCDLFASEFIEAQKIRFPKGYGELQRGMYTPVDRMRLETLKKKSIERVGELGLIVGVTYEVTYILLGHYERKVIGEFRHFTESMVTAIFKLPEELQHEREISMAVEIINGQMEPILTEGPRGSVDQYHVINAVTICKTMGIPVCSIVEVKEV